MTGTRARPWLDAINQHERDSRAALIDKRPEPGFVATLHEAVTHHPRFARIAVILAGLALLGVIA